MRALAEFIMRGRVRAVLIAMVGIPLISPGALALVSLRRGSGDGLMVLVWALLPMVAASAAGIMSPLMAGLSATHFAAVFAGSMLLRSRHSWVPALVGLSLVAALGMLLTAHWSGGLQQSLVQAAEGNGGPELGQLFSSEALVTGYLAWISAISATLALVLGRWWQALLYNPGGLREEFHRLRMPLPLAAAGMLAWVFCLVTEGLAFWGALAAFPVAVAGIALVHGLAAQRGWGRAPLVAMYVLLVIAALPLVGFLCGLALIDSWIDIRGRASGK